MKMPAILIAAVSLFALSQGAHAGFEEQLSQASRSLACAAEQAAAAPAPKKTPADPRLKACDAAVERMGGVYGGYELYLLTDTHAYYYHENCDICAELDRCDLQTQEVGMVFSAHSVSCEDMEPFRKGKVLFDYCAK